MAYNEKLDCMRCGACCCNAQANVDAGSVDYIPVNDPKSRLLRDNTLNKRYVVHNAEGEPHLRLDPSGRCNALRGRLGYSVFCVIYQDRPGGCKRVQAGDKECERARREKGLL
ncbi:YkgJ family cysteine cluster protein [Myxococcota bacterium]|nr:YkgJ family cysteine cluster protein [Myxococcota bacterium]